MHFVRDFARTLCLPYARVATRNCVFRCSITRERPRALKVVCVFTCNILLLGPTIAPHTTFNAQGLPRVMEHRNTPLGKSSGPTMLSQGPHRVLQRYRETSAVLDIVQIPRREHALNSELK